MFSQLDLNFLLEFYSCLMINLEYNSFDQPGNIFFIKFKTYVIS